MNNRIRELAFQSAGGMLSYDSEGSFKLSEQEVEKFAELIVKECAQFVEDKFDFIGDEIIVKEKMLEHFGVE
jgi:hypothetical protein